MVDVQTLRDLKTYGFQEMMRRRLEEADRAEAEERAERKADEERAAKMGMTVEQMERHEYLQANRPLPVPYSQIVAEEVNWLWPEKVPRGMVTIFSGDPGLGKSYVTLDMAMRLSRGVSWPGEEGNAECRLMNAESERQSQNINSVNSTLHSAICNLKSAILPDSAICNHHSEIRPPAGAIILNADDSKAKTIRPRLERMGADMDHVLDLSHVLIRDVKTRFLLDRDFGMLKRTIVEMKNCQLVVLDPLSAYLQASGGGKADARALIERLSNLAEEMNVAIVVVNHLRKGSGSAIHRSLGSISVIGRARAAWGFTRCKEDPSRRLMVPLKNNLATDSEGLAYSITDGRIEWESEPIEISADEAFLPVRKARSPDALKKATEWLREKLEDGLPVLQSEIIQMGERDGHSQRTLERAKKALGVEGKPAAKAGQWFWSLRRDDLEAAENFAEIVMSRRS